MESFELRRAGPTAMSNRVRLSKEEVTVIDGPFAKTKEVNGGFAIFEVESKQEMIDATPVSPIILQAIGSCLRD